MIFGNIFYGRLRGFAVTLAMAILCVSGVAVRFVVNAVTGLLLPVMAVIYGA
jgi:hypothetical protein